TLTRRRAGDPWWTRTDRAALPGCRRGSEGRRLGGRGRPTRLEPGAADKLRPKSISRRDRRSPAGVSSYEKWPHFPIFTNSIVDRDRGTPRGATPPTPPGVRVTYHGGSTGLSLDRDIETGETERVGIVVTQGLLDRRVSGHAPEPRRRTSGNRCIELGYAATAQVVEAVVPVPPLPPKLRAQSSAEPRFQAGEYTWGLAEAEVAAPSDEV